MAGTSRGRLATYGAPLGLAAVVLFGAWTRSSGFTSKDLWFDDAWEVLTAKVGLGTAVHMVNTTPLYSLLLRSWVQLGPAHAWWAQIPAFVLGLASIVAVYAVLRYFGAWWPVALTGALVIAVSPVVVTYSTRVKQFNADILLACVLLWLFERWRRRPTRAGVVVLAATGSVALLISATTAVVVGAICVVAVCWAIVAPRRRGDAAWLVATVVVVGVVEYVVWLRHLSASLYRGWTSRGYIFSIASLHRAEFSLQAMGSEVFHWMLGAPTGHPAYPSHRVTAGGLVIAAGAFLVLLALVALPIVRSARRLREAPDPFAMPALCVGIAVVLALLELSPFGGGRTDEVLYPAILLLCAGAIAPRTSSAAERSRTASRAVLAGVVVVSLCCVAVGVTHRATYPTTSVRDAYDELAPNVKPGDVIVVDPWVTFTWAADGLTPTRVSLASTYFPWSQGFHVVSRRRSVVISTNYFFPDASYATLSTRTSRLWYVGVGKVASARHPTPARRLLVTRNYRALVALGWRPTDTAYYASHVIAILMVYPPRH